MKDINNQRGSLVLVAVIIVALLALGAATVVAVRNLNKTVGVSPSPTPAPTTATSVVPSSTPAAPPSAQTASASVLAKVQALYTAYAKSPNEPVARPFLTPALDAKIKSGQYYSDPVLCAQNQPSTLKYDQPQMSSTSAVVVVHEAFGRIDNPVTVTVDLGTLLVSDVKCP